MANSNNNGVAKRTLWIIVTTLLFSSFGFSMYVLGGVYNNAQDIVDNAKKIIRNEMDIEFIKEKVGDNNEMLKVLIRKGE